MTEKTQNPEREESPVQASDADRAFPGIGVNSGSVMTVLGPVPVDALGITLTHEHIFSDISPFWQEPTEATKRQLAYQPVAMEILGELRLAPHINRDNQRLTDLELAVREVSKFRDLGGDTIVEATTVGLGRDPLALKAVARRTGLNIVMGAGYYVGVAHPSTVRSMSADDIADEIVRDLTEGVPGTGVRAGIIGEIGVDVDFTAEEEKSLRGAGRAARRTQVPLSVHLSGGVPPHYAQRVVDIVEEEGASLRHTLLGHVVLHTPALEDQMALAERGIFLGYDGVSCNYDWGVRGFSPCDEKLAMNIKRLIEAGCLHRILLSHDVHSKIMLTAYGGFGYGYILRRFVHRLRAHGVTGEQIQALLVENPRRFFSARPTG